ncbi:MAG: PQQ-binding-like beta-propeller repeat protein [Myxococcales bacterium]|nr:PQQ-binding-like beta-propeller repeat protein [Myxococcales bacterium]
MPPVRPSLVLALSLLGACKKDPPPPEVDESPEAKRQRECDHFATDMAQTAMLAGQMMVTALEDDPMSPSARAGRSEMSEGARKLRKDLYDKCLTWPEDVMQCLPPLGTLREGCEERLMAAMDGATAIPKDVPAGPKPAWTFTFESDPGALGVTEDGTVLAIAGVENDALVGLREGKVAWQKQGDHARWLLPLPGAEPTWVTAEGDRLVAFDPRTGTERWSATLPALPEEEYGTMAVRTAAVRGDGLLIADAEARFFAVSPERCAAPGGSGCLEAQGRLDDEELDSDARLWVDAEDRRYLLEDDALRIFLPTGQRHATLGAHDDLGQVLLAGSELVLLVDDDVVVLDPARCSSGAPIASSGWPQPGAMVLSESECEGCVEPPEGCRKWRAHVPGSTHERPARLDDGAVVVSGESYVHAVHEGSSRWKTALGTGPVITDGTRLLGLGAGVDEEPAALYEADPSTGMPRWRSPLPTREGDSTYLEGDATLALRGRWLAAALDQTLTVVELPGS